MENTVFLFTLILIVTHFFIAICDKENVESRTVKITQGLVRGYKNDEWGIFEFHGIPYATMPKGPKKFKAPLPGPVWMDTFEAINADIKCAQVAFADTVDECLIANIFVPDTEEKNLPVVVNVHGGAYQSGSGNLLTPKNLVKTGNFIGITFNYRLGVHGFLCLGTEDIPGNAGMKDQVAALRWIKKNIASFGGNPDEITIAGSSAGSSAVELLALSETTRGLFKRVIPESGASLSAWSIQQDPIKNAKTFAKRFQIETDDVFALEEFYKRTPVKDLNIDDFFTAKDTNFIFVPCVEQETGSEPFLKEAPSTILKNSNFPKLPTLVGFANMEGIFRLPQFEQWKDEMNEKFSEFLPADLAFETEEQKEELAKVVKHFYFGNNPVSHDTMQGYIDYFTDVMFAYSIMRSLRGQVMAGNKNVFLYEFSYADNYTQSITPYNVLGAEHCAQSLIILEYEYSLVNESEVSAEYIKLKELMTETWINFIKSGKPVPEATAAFPEGWPASSANGSPYMDLNMPPKLKKGILLEERMKFWESIYERFYSTPKAPSAPSKANRIGNIHVFFLFTSYLFLTS